MCGVFGYIGTPGQAAPQVIAGLSRLEYRGYDSAGICMLDASGDMQIVRSVGKVSGLKNKVDTYDTSRAHIAIGHTRWATHGGVTEANCHPHISGSGRYAVIHNGIIENHTELRNELIAKGYTFASQTDTEVTVQLFDHIYDGDIVSTMKHLVSRMHGAYGLVFMDRENPDILFGTKKWSPMVIGMWKNWEKYISSDYRSLIWLIDDYIILEDGDIFTVSATDYSIYSTVHTATDSTYTDAHRDVHTVDESEKPIDLGDFPHFMLKEIWEQPSVLQDVFRGRINHDTHELHSDTMERISALGIQKITIVASGTSYHSGLIWKYYIEEYANIPTDVVVSTEFKYKKKFVSPDELYIFVSQSGETLDTLDSLKIVKDQGGHVFGIVNVPGSAIARTAGQGLFTRAGVEVGVASTKAFTAQSACFLFFALYIGKKKNLDYRIYRQVLDAIRTLPADIEQILLSSEAIRTVANRYSTYKNFFFLGRGVELPIAMEGSLKLKELTYIHSEAYSSGELKHGSIALIDTDFPSIMVDGGGPLSAKNASSTQEILARGGKVLGIVATTDPARDIYTDTITYVPTLPDLSIFLEVVILQLFAYHVAGVLGRDIDKPRNLAKSVTVE